MKPIDSATRRTLRARAHHLEPVVMIGEAGLTPEVLREVEAALRAHELIKVRVLGDQRGVRKALVGDIAQATGAEPVQSIGKILVFYRERAPEEQKTVRRRPRPKPPRRTKRSYQRS